MTIVSKSVQSFGYFYNGASSQLTQMTLPGGSKTNYVYDTVQRLTSLQSVKSDDTTNLAKFDYAYNTRDVRTSVDKQIGTGSTQTVAYTYDEIDQLTKELSSEPTPVLNKEYSYDAMGNRTTSSVSGLPCQQPELSHANSNRLWSDYPIIYTYLEPVITLVNREVCL